MTGAFSSPGETVAVARSADPTNPADRRDDRKTRGPERGEGSPWVLRVPDVSVWWVDLDDAAWPVQHLEASLSPAERRRAGAFAFPQDRRRFVVRRGILRLLLSKYLGCLPSSVCFSYGPAGKPELALPAGVTPIRFNCSHSHGLAVQVFARGRRVGIDLEAVRHLPEAEAIAAQCFSPREHSELAGLRGRRLEEAVLRGWTMKEAYVKAIGEGLGKALEEVEVAAAPGEIPALRAISGDSGTAAKWTLQALSPGPGYVAALVVEGQAYELSGRTAEETASDHGLPRRWVAGPGLV